MPTGVQPTSFRLARRRWLDRGRWTPNWNSCARVHCTLTGARTARAGSAASSSTVQIVLPPKVPPTRRPCATTWSSSSPTRLATTSRCGLAGRAQRRRPLRRHRRPQHAAVEHARTARVADVRRPAAHDGLPARWPRRVRRTGCRRAVNAASRARGLGLSARHRRGQRPAARAGWHRLGPAATRSPSPIRCLRWRARAGCRPCWPGARRAAPTRCRVPRRRSVSVR